MARRVMLLVTDLLIGGTPTVVRELALRLHGEGVEVQVACLASWGPTADQIRAGGVQVTALGATGAADLGVFSRLGALLKRERPDVVLSFLVHANVAAAVAKLRNRSFTLHQSIQTTQPKPRWHWLAQAAAQYAADRIVVPSPSIAEIAGRRSRIPSHTFVVIPNAVDPEEYSGLMRPPRAEGVVWVGFVGRLDPVKRIPDLVDAVSGLGAGYELHIYGEGSEEQVIRERIALKGAEGRVHLLGTTLSPREVISAMDVLALPSEAEGFGLVLIEAMAAGVPAVATDAPGIRDVVRDEANGLLVPVGNTAALAKAIQRIASDAPLRERLVAEGRETVRQRFSWAQVLPMYRALLGV